MFSAYFTWLLMIDTRILKSKYFWGWVCDVLQEIALSNQEDIEWKIESERGKLKYFYGWREKQNISKHADYLEHIIITVAFLS